MVSMVFFVYKPLQGDIEDDVDSEGGVMPVQLPLSFHAAKARDDAEAAALEADIKGLIKLTHQ